MTYKVAGVMYREYEHPLVRGSANYTPHDWGDHNSELQLGLRFGAWHSKDVVRIRADSRFAMRRLRKKNFDGVGEIVGTPMGPALLLDHRLRWKVRIRRFLLCICAILELLPGFQ